jgi:hypothetical protein
MKAHSTRTPTYPPRAHANPQKIIGPLAVALSLMIVMPGYADQTISTNSPDTTFFSPVGDYFANWFSRVSETQSEQPHWVTPVVTVTPPSGRRASL